MNNWKIAWLYGLLCDFLSNVALLGSGVFEY